MQSSNRLRQSWRHFSCFWGLLYVAVGVGCTDLDISSRAHLESCPFGWSGDSTDAACNVAAAADIALDFSIVLVGYGVFMIWAARLMWRGQVMLGWWLNTVLLGIADAAFVIALMIPGHVPLSEGLWAPFSTCSE